MTPEEMRRLQTRLLEVEGRMNKLMSAIKTVGAKTNDMADQILADEKEGSQSDSDVEPHETACDLHQKASNQKPVQKKSANHSDDDDEHSANQSDDYDLSVNESEIELDDVDREEVDEIYAEIESSGDEMIGGVDDTEMGGVRRRNVPAFTEGCEEDE